MTLTGWVSADVGQPTHVGQKILHSWVPDSQVPRSHRTYVEAHVRRLTRRHKLGDVRVRYFGPPRRNPQPMEVDGRVTNWGDFYVEARDVDHVTMGVNPDANTIALYYGVRGELVPFLVAHEIRHLIGKRSGEPADEAEADRFASRYVRGRR